MRTEWSIYSVRYMVAGQIDSIWVDPKTRELHMIDWKRCLKDLDPSEGEQLPERYQRYGKPPCDDMLDNKFNHYAVQQNLYAAILREHYGINLSSMWLVQIHEQRDSYCMLEVPAFLEAAASMLERHFQTEFGEGIAPTWEYHQALLANHEEVPRTPDGC